MAVQFTPPRAIDDQDEIDRLRATHTAPPDVSADPRTLDQEQRQRIGRLAFRWFFIRIIFWTPLILTVAVPAGGLAYLVTAAGVFSSQSPAMPWFFAVCVGFTAGCYVVRYLGGIAGFRGPLRLHVGAPRTFLDAAAGGIFSALISIYCAYVVSFYGAAILLAIALMSPPSGPLVRPG